MNGTKLKPLTPEDVKEGAKNLRRIAGMKDSAEVRKFLEELNREGLPPSRMPKTAPSSRKFEAEVRRIVEDKRTR